MAIVLDGYSVCALLFGILGVFLLVLGLQRDTTHEFLIQLAKRMLVQ